MEIEVLSELSNENERNLEIPSRAVDSKSLSKKKVNVKSKVGCNVITGVEVIINFCNRNW